MAPSVKEEFSYQINREAGPYGEAAGPMPGRLPPPFGGQRFRPARQFAARGPLLAVVEDAVTSLAIAASAA
eukprot:CAMPEP_0203869328 /NCGR_PEP_ID=MMETSP0359-20131031/17638_1 /ASSEMBLY_ACC=CAM_ASM_000338 /TAXON_ID=268821 /ORGANISM="Scrippsiella Hangoei, Strain SHTV-5" /LENGTH=70 /DNA_ID=CAMNT_0050787909 /DNA_START=87 /DNA_END=296 /DNA_ORIENTATION=+